MIAWLSSPVVSWFPLAWGWFLGYLVAWSLILLAYLLSAHQRRRRRRVWAETQPAIDKGIAELRKQGPLGFRFADMLERPDPLE